MTKGIDARYIIQAQQRDEALKDRYELEQRIDMLEKLVFILLNHADTIEASQVIEQFRNNAPEEWVSNYYKRWC